MEVPTVRLATLPMSSSPSMRSSCLSSSRVGPVGTHEECTGSSRHANVIIGPRCGRPARIQVNGWRTVHEKFRPRVVALHRML